ncbi:hypothetical protein M758_4G123300 [Ceratodon purpureus]|nr:hypothetical protein M758_4G123300 [Ceratodon purpureus]
MAYPLSTMIRDAVIHIRQQKGTSLNEIRKHLEKIQNKKLDGINKKMLTSTLTGLVQTGKLQKKGSNYKLATSKKSIPTKDVPSRRHHHCTRPTRFRRGYRKPNPRGHRHCPRRSRRRRRRRRTTRRRRRVRRRRRRRRRGRRGRKHHHCTSPMRTRRGYREPNKTGHRHCPRSGGGGGGNSKLTDASGRSSGSSYIKFILCLFAYYAYSKMRGD